MMPLYDDVGPNSLKKITFTITDKDHSKLFHPFLANSV